MFVGDFSFWCLSLMQYLLSFLVLQSSRSGDFLGGFGSWEEELFFSGRWGAGAGNYFWGAGEQVHTFGDLESTGVIRALF